MIEIIKKNINLFIGLFGLIIGAGIFFMGVRGTPSNTPLALLGVAVSIIAVSFIVVMNYFERKRT